MLTRCVRGLETTLLVPLTAQVYKRLLANCWGSVRNTWGRRKLAMDFMLHTPGVNVGRVNLLVFYLVRWPEQLNLSFFFWRGEGIM